MNIQIGQTWISETHPHESFKIYDGVVDTCVDAFSDETIEFDKQPESCKIFFWERCEKAMFEKFLDEKLGIGRDSSYPYAWCGESKKSSIVKKIRKYNMKTI